MANPLEALRVLLVTQGDVILVIFDLSGLHKHVGLRHGTARAQEQRLSPQPWSLVAIDAVPLCRC